MRLPIGPLLGLVLMLPVGAEAEEGAADPAASPEVELEQLLVLPDSLEYGGVERKGGATRQEWRSRFEGARQEVVESRQALARAQQKLARAAQGSSNWSIAPPGVGNVDVETNNPGQFQLRQEVKRLREDVSAAEQRLRELHVEASLAGVPADWRDRVDGAPTSR